MDLSTKRKELWVLVFSVLFLGVEVGIIANIIFTNFYEENEIVFTIVSILVLAITITVITRVMFKYDNKYYGITMLFAFDGKEKKFIDIPYSSSSVNARVLFNSQSLGVQKKIQGNIIKNNNSESNFVNDAVAQIILSKVIKHNKGYGEKIDREKLKDVLVKYKYINVDDILGGEKLGNLKTIELTLPKGFKLVPTDNKSLRIKSSYGFLDLKWEFGSYSNNWSSGYNSGVSYISLLSTFENLNIDNCVEIQVRIELEYGFNPLKLFMKDTKEFSDFIERCKEGMDKFDINRSKEKFNANAFPRLVGYLDEKFESSKDAERVNG